MKGSYQISVGNNRVRYEFSIKRNITLIQGDSATGKTTLIKLIDTYYNLGKSSGISLQCEKECVVLRGRDWERQLENIKDSIVFIDEGNKFVSSNDFARAVSKSDNYFVIVTREDLFSLPYSIHEIYGIQKSGKTLKSKQTYNEMFSLYGKYASSSNIKPTMVITEDSNAGYDFFCKVCEQKGIKCISANGKNRIVKNIIPRPEDAVLIVADGAAYGPEMRETVEKMEKHPNYVIYLPESFEWLILKSEILKADSVKRILEHPEVYIESGEYISWERYFTWLLEEVTADSDIVPKYHKTGKLDGFYTNDSNRNKILSQLGNVHL